MFHVEHLTVSDLDRQAFVSAASEMGVDLNTGQQEQLWAYEAVLHEWSDRVRLVSRGDRDLLRTRHLLDSLSAVPLLPPATCRMLDLGSGGGLPGIVLHIARPDLETVLVESARMKVLFLRNVRERLGLAGLEIVHGRAESREVLCEHEGRYSCVTVRAVAALDRIWELSKPFLGSTGWMLAYKGPRALEELGDREQAGLDVKEHPVEVPGLGRPRCLVRVRRADPGAV